MPTPPTLTTSISFKHSAHLAVYLSPVFRTERQTSTHLSLNRQLPGILRYSPYKNADNQAVVKCQILQECSFQNFNKQKFQNMEHSNSQTVQELSRAIAAPGLIMFPIVISMHKISLSLSPTTVI